MDDAYVQRFERRVVGAKEHEELWVPAEELDQFNGHIEGEIDVIAAYFGHPYEGDVPEGFGLRGKDARAQFLALARTLPYSGFDVLCETAANHVAVFLNFFLWEQCDFSAEGVSVPERDEVLRKLKSVWSERGLALAPLGLVNAYEPKAR